MTLTMLGRFPSVLGGAGESARLSAGMLPVVGSNEEQRGSVVAGCGRPIPGVEGRHAGCALPEVLGRGCGVYRQAGPNLGFQDRCDKTDVGRCDAKVAATGYGPSDAMSVVAPIR